MLVPNYRLPGEIALCCAACKNDDMVDVIYKMCQCGKVASFGMADNKPTHCNNCKSTNIMTVIGKIYKQQHCTTSVNDKHDGYYLRFYINLFLDKPVYQNVKIK